MRVLTVLVAASIIYLALLLAGRIAGVNPALVAVSIAAVASTALLIDRVADLLQDSEEE
jgi:uncharacterized membrane protein